MLVLSNSNNKKNKPFQIIFFLFKDSSPANEESRSKAILRTIEKNEHGFRPKASTVTKETFTTYTNGSVIESEMMQTEDVESSLNEDKVSKSTGGVST